MSTPRTPILWSVRPDRHARARRRSTMKAVTESCARLAGSAVLANTVYQSASRTPDIQHLVPFSTQPPASSGSGVARVRMPMTSLPGLGLGQAEGGALRARGDAGQVALLLLLGPGDHHRARGQAGEQQHERGGVGVLGHLLDGDGEPEDARPRPAVLLGDAQAEQPGVAEGLEDVGRVLAAGVDLPGPGLHLVAAPGAAPLAWSSASSGERSKSIAGGYACGAATAPPRHVRTARPRRAQRHGDLDLHRPAPGQRRHADGGPGVAAVIAEDAVQHGGWPRPPRPVARGSRGSRPRSPVTVRTRATRSRLPSACSSTARALSAHTSAARAPSSTVTSRRACPHR